MRWWTRTLNRISVGLKLFVSYTACPAAGDGDTLLTKVCATTTWLINEAVHAAASESSVLCADIRYHHLCPRPPRLASRRGCRTTPAASESPGLVRAPEMSGKVMKSGHDGGLCRLSRDDRDLLAWIIHVRARSMWKLSPRET